MRNMTSINLSRRHVPKRPLKLNWLEVNMLNIKDRLVKLLQCIARAMFHFDIAARLKSRLVAPYFVKIGSRRVFAPVPQGSKQACRQFFLVWHDDSSF